MWFSITLLGPHYTLITPPYPLGYAMHLSSNFSYLFEHGYCNANSRKMTKNGHCSNFMLEKKTKNIDDTFKCSYI